MADNNRMVDTRNNSKPTEEDIRLKRPPRLTDKQDTNPKDIKALTKPLKQMPTEGNKLKVSTDPCRLDTHPRQHQRRLALGSLQRLLMDKPITTMSKREQLSGTSPRECHRWRRFDTRACPLLCFLF